MKKITMFVEDVPEAGSKFNVMPFIPVEVMQENLQDRFQSYGDSAYEQGFDEGYADGKKEVIEFVKDNPPPVCEKSEKFPISFKVDPETGKIRAIPNIPVPDYIEGETPLVETMAFNHSPMPLKHCSIEPDDVTVVPAGIIINGRFMPAQTLFSAANAVNDAAAEELEKIEHKYE